MEQGFLVRLKAAAGVPVGLAKQRRMRILFEATTLAGMVGAKLVNPAADYSLERMAVGAGFGFLTGVAVLGQSYIYGIEREDLAERARQREAARRQEQRDFIMSWNSYAERHADEGKTPNVDQFLEDLD